jgi:hypothetical protein
LVVQFAALTAAGMTSTGEVAGIAEVGPDAVLFGLLGELEAARTRRIPMRRERCAMPMAARQKRASEIQCGSRTTMRCMTAIWARRAAKTQQRNAQPEARCFGETDTVRRQASARPERRGRAPTTELERMNGGERAAARLGG